MKLVIIAGGKGTRLGLSDIPKPMVEIGGKPILEHQIECAARYGIDEITILTGYLGHKIREYFGNGIRWGVHIRYMDEQKALGTAGAVLQLRDEIAEEFMIFYGDLAMDLDLPSLVDYHHSHDDLATIAVHPNDHPSDSDLVETNETGVVTAFHSKPHDVGACYPNLVSAALYVFRPEIFDFILDGEDFGRNVFPRILKCGARIRAYKTFEYIKDMGTPARLARVEEDLVSGKIAAKNRSRRQRAVFLDRDGVLNVEVGGVCAPDELELVKGAATAISAINKSGFLAIVVTNQPVVAKGFCTEATLQQIHNKLETELGKEGAYLDHIYHCPHHPEAGFPGELPELKIECQCRKPKSGMLSAASREFNVDLGRSYMIGDREVDVQAGAGAGARTVRLDRKCPETRSTVSPTSADFCCKTLSEAVAWILDKEPVRQALSGGC